MASEIVLLNISGQDQPGLMAMLTSALADYQVRILDLGQAVIHDGLTLGMLLEIPAADPARDSAATGRRTEQVLAMTGELARDHGVTLSVTRISGREYADWVAGQGKPRHIITLLAAGFTSEQIAAVSQLTHRYGLNIDTVRRLTGRIPLDAEAGSTRTSIEMILRGEPTSSAELKAELLAAADRLAFDFSVQQDSVYRRHRRLVAFDMDSTLIDAEVIDELAAHHGLREPVARITEQAMRGELSFKESFTARARLLAGLPETALSAVADRVALNDGADRLIRTLKHFGYKTAILSGGFQYVGERLRANLGIDYVYANRLEVVDGRMTGGICGEIVDAARKAELLEEIAGKEGISLQQTIAIGDGANDLPMLSRAGLGVAYHAKPLVKETASHAISNFGLDSVLYLMGFSDQDIEQALSE